MSVTTHTRVHTRVTFANPHLVCSRCRARAEGFHEPEQCGCLGSFRLLPCGHVGEPVSTCPSWGPVDGCSCQTPCPLPAPDSA